MDEIIDFNGNDDSDAFKFKIWQLLCDTGRTLLGIQKVRQLFEYFAIVLFARPATV